LIANLLLERRLTAPQPRGFDEDERMIGEQLDFRADVAAHVLDFEGVEVERRAQSVEFVVGRVRGTNPRRAGRDAGLAKRLDVGGIIRFDLLVGVDERPDGHALVPR
jgi:hypothetical protein